LHPDERFTARLIELAAAGYTFAIDERDIADFPVEKLAALVAHIAIVRVDVKSVKTGAQIRDKIARFGAGPLRFLAERVETLKQFEVCKALGFRYFQGYFFARPHILESKKIASGHATVIDLINRLNDETTDMEEIREKIMRDPGLTISLLRYVNSPFFPTKREIASITQALGLLGRHPLLNWLLLTLYSNTNETAFKDPLLESVMLRSELMAAFAKRFRMEKSQCEKAYLVGMLSLLSPLLGAKIEDIFQEISFDDEIKSALLKKEGALGNLLKLIVLIERGEYTKTLAILSRLKITENEYTRILSDTYATTEAYLRR
jgi:EAL and modified HD-GYP domain-containing signal transduction protein